MSKIKGTKKELSSKQIDELLTKLKTRFEKNINRHKDIKWENVLAKLEKNTEKL